MLTWLIFAGLVTNLQLTDFNLMKWLDMNLYVQSLLLDIIVVNDIEIS